MSNTLGLGVKKSKKTARKRTKLSIEQITTNLANMTINYSSTNIQCCSSTESNNQSTHVSLLSTHVPSSNPHVDFVLITNQENMCGNSTTSTNELFSSWNNINQYAIRFRQTDEETAQFKELSDEYEELLLDYMNVCKQLRETKQEFRHLQNELLEKS